MRPSESLGRNDSVGRFFGKVAKGASCWLWIGCQHRQGYGIARRNYKKVLAHRLSWEIHFGAIPHGLDVCHHCDNPQCVNPTHLFLGTHQQNMDDMRTKGRQALPRRGELNGYAKLTASQVREIIARRGESQTALGLEFSTHPTNIAFIQKRKTWRHLDAPK